MSKKISFSKFQSLLEPRNLRVETIYKRRGKPVLLKMKGKRPFFVKMEGGREFDSTPSTATINLVLIKTESVIKKLVVDFIVDKNYVLESGERLYVMVDEKPRVFSLTGNIDSEFPLDYVEGGPLQKIPSGSVEGKIEIFSCYGFDELLDLIKNPLEDHLVSEDTEIKTSFEEHIKSFQETLLTNFMEKLKTPSIQNITILSKLPIILDSFS